MPDSQGKKPVLLVIAGRAGAGKTTFANLLGKSFGWVVLDKDCLTREFTDKFLSARGSSSNDRDSAIYEEIVATEYRAVFGVASHLIHAGLNVIVDIPFVRQIQNLVKSGETTIHDTRCVSNQLGYVWFEKDDLDRGRTIEV